MQTCRIPVHRMLSFYLVNRALYKILMSLLLFQHNDYKYNLLS